MKNALYGYQQRDADAIKRKMIGGARRIAYILPTGGGKTKLISYFAEFGQQRGRKVWVFVDRTVLVDQTSADLLDEGLWHGVIQAGHRPSELPIQVASAQTLEKRKRIPECDLAIIDEAHAQRKFVMDALKQSNTLTIGLTATPTGKGMGLFYEDIVSTTTTNELIDIREPRRVLVPLKLGVGTPIAEEHLEKASTGEYTAQSVSKSIDAMLGDPVQEWHQQTLKNYGGPVPTLVSTNTIADGKKLEGEYQAAGFRAVQVSANDTPGVKKQKIRDLRRGTIHILISCTMLERGFNEPAIRCIQLFRRYAQNLGGVIQILGRGMRWQAGKEDCLVIDHSGNLEGYAPEIAYIYENGFHDLDMSERKVRIREGDRKEREQAKCPQCGNVLIRKAPNCDTCGYALSEDIAKTITVGAVFREIDLRNLDHVQSLDKDEKQDLWAQLCALGSERHPWDEKKAGAYTYAQWGSIMGFNTRPPSKYYKTNQKVTAKVRNTVKANFDKWKAEQAA